MNRAGLGLSGLGLAGPARARRVPVGSPEDEPRLPAPVLVVALVGFTVIGGLSAVFELLLVPLYLGSVIFPVTLLLVVIGNVMLPRLVRGLVNAAAASLLPIVGWLAVVAVMGFLPSGMGDVLLPGYGSGQYVGEALVLLGLFSGVISVFVDSGRRRVPMADASTEVTARNR
jgi:hypothetical protein